MKIEKSDTNILKNDFSEIFYHKELIENKIFSQKEARDMFDILTEIHSALKDKSINTGKHKISVVELVWFRYMDNLFSMTEKEYLIQLGKTAYHKYKVIPRGEYVVIHETALEVDPKSELYKIVKEYAEKKVLEVDKNFSVKR